jgi:hypothetical protein
MLVCVISGIYLRFVFEDVINPFLDKLKELLD